MNHHVANVYRYGLRLLGLSLVGCVEPFMPDVLDSGTTYLVVDGFIKGNGVTRIRLSRTTGLAATATLPVEKGARIFIVDDAGQRYNLTEKSSGNYQSDSLLLNPARQYQLRLTTVANTSYESTLVPLKVTPAIDDLGWKFDGDQIQTQLSTHDASGRSRYYRWSFIETWEFHPLYQSQLEYNAQRGIIVYRTTPIYTCWRTERASTIKQGSSIQLSQDALTNVPVVSISNRAERLQIRYSVLVSQMAETAEEFAYFDLLRKNTEAIGTVNDPLPVQLTGNVHRVDNAQEPVLGFVGAHTVQQKRLFIDRSELNLSTSWLFDTPYKNCVLNEERLPDESKPPTTIPFTRIYNNPGSVPIDYITDNQGNKLGYYGGTRECVDCRVRGTTTKPDYW